MTIKKILFIPIMRFFSHQQQSELKFNGYKKNYLHKNYYVKVRKRDKIKFTKLLC